MNNETPDNYIQRNDYTEEPGPPEDSAYDSNFPCETPPAVVDNATNETRNIQPNRVNLYMNTEQRDTSHLIQPDNWEDLSEAQQNDWMKQMEVSAYWKSKEGTCLACGAEIAVEDQYCKACTEFLVEAHTTRNPLT